MKPLRTAFKDGNINYLKGGPAHTSKAQDFDCGRLYYSLKAGVKHVNKEEINVRNLMLRRNMDAAIKEFQDIYDIDLHQLKEKIIYGHKVVVFSASKHWTGHKMKESSKIVGIHSDDWRWDCKLSPRHDPYT